MRVCIFSLAFLLKELEAHILVNVLVSGACGRMGQAVVKAVMEDPELELVGAVDLKGGADAGEMVGLGKSGVVVQTDLAAAIQSAKPQVMVDFTRPDVVFQDACTALKLGVSPVIGTTGLSDEAKKEIAELMANSWYDASLDEAALVGTIQTLAASANQYVVQHPIVYRGIVAAIHKSGKGADIYISPKQIFPVFKRLFQTREVFRPGAFVELLCDKRSDEDTPISVKEIERFTSENICAYSGVLALKEKGFGFVDSVFVPPFLIGAHTNGDKVVGVAVMKFNKVKNTIGLSAITVTPAN